MISSIISYIWKSDQKEGNSEKKSHVRKSVSSGKRFSQSGLFKPNHKAIWCKPNTMGIKINIKTINIFYHTAKQQ